MTNDSCKTAELSIDLARLSEGEREEMIALGILSKEDCILPYIPVPVQRKRPLIHKRAAHAPQVLNEAYNYSPRPSSFSRGLCVDMNGITMLFVSGTASVDEAGKTAHVGDFRAQCWRTYRNITGILVSEGMTWHDVVRTTCYLRDIERDYQDFNEVRTAFFRWLGLDPLPASTGVQARLCREELLVEIEVIAVSPSNSKD
ncbi:MAG: Rid family hydrolase [Anaerolineales bacterium]